MANFDKTKWYQISTSGGGLSFVGTPAVLLDNKTTVQPYGAVFLRNTNSTDREQQWQIYPINDTTLVLRTRAAGPSNYLGTAIDFGETGDLNGGNTKPLMGNYTLLDSSMFWNVGDWPDGLFWFENAQNGSSWHLNHTGNGYFDMSSNITAPQQGQSFKFKAVADIKDDKWSTVDMPGATATAAPKGSSTMVNPDPESSSGGGLSTGAKAAIGASIGGAILIIALVIALLWLRRRRKQGGRTTTITDGPYGYTPVHETQTIQQPNSRSIEPTELPAGKVVAIPLSSKLHNDEPTEMEHFGPPPAELPGNDVR